MRNFVLNILNKKDKVRKKCIVDLDLLVELKCKGYHSDCFYEYLVIDKGIVQIWISEKDDKFLVEFREPNCDIICKRELKESNSRKELEIEEKMKNAITCDEVEKLLKKMREHIENPIEMSDIIATKEVLRSTTIKSKKELFKFLNK